MLAALLLLSPIALGQDCAQQGSSSLMDILNDIQQSWRTKVTEGTAEEEQLESEPPIEPTSQRAYVSTEQEHAPIQRAGSGLPAGSTAIRWQRPSSWTWYVDFDGQPGRNARHEGVDYVHDDPKVPEVPVVTAAEGEVVYVRLGCPQSGLFGKNRSARECGSGWGNHVVVHHGNGVYVRYAHLHPEGVTVGVGDTVRRGETLGLMGNSGRSETRHLHWELGTKQGGFEPDAPAQSFDRVHDPGMLPFR